MDPHITFLLISAVLVGGGVAQFSTTPSMYGDTCMNITALCEAKLMDAGERSWVGQNPNHYKSLCTKPNSDNDDSLSPGEEFVACMESARNTSQCEPQYWAQGYMDGFGALCSAQGIAGGYTEYRPCLNSPELQTDLDQCRQFYLHSEADRQIKEIRSGDIKEATGIAALCRTTRYFMKCVRRVTWAKCGNEKAAEWMRNFTRDFEVSDFFKYLMLNQSLSVFTCGNLDDEVMRGMGWSMGRKTKQDFYPQPRILRVGGDPEVSLPRIMNGGNLTGQHRWIRGVTGVFEFRGIAADYWSNALIWFNRAKKQLEMAPYWFSGTAAVHTVFRGCSNEVRGMSIDWVSGNVYWTDVQYAWVAMSSYRNHGRHRIIARTNLKKPMDVVAYPQQGWLFWSDSGRKVIERSTLWGDDRQVFLHNVSVVSLSIDYEAKKLYWNDEAAMKIYRTGISPSGMALDTEVVARLSNFNIMDLTVYKDYGIATTNSGDVKVFHTSNGTWLGSIGRAETDSQIINSYSLTIYAPEQQKPSNNPCFYDNGGCDGLCFAKNETTRVCNCSLGFEPRGTQCVSITVDDRFILVADSYGRDVYQINLRNDDVIGVPIRDGVTPYSLTFNPLNKTIFYINAKRMELHETSLDGSYNNIIVKFKSENPYEISFDEVKNRLYFTDAGRYKGVSYVDLDSPNRTVHNILRLNNEPTDLHLDTINRTVYFIYGYVAKIERCNMDTGEDCMVLVDRDIYSSNGFAIDFRTQEIFFVNWETGIQRVNLLGQGRRPVYENFSRRMFSLALDTDYLYVSDLDLRNLIKINRTDSSEVREIGAGEFQTAIALHLYDSRLLQGIDLNATQLMTELPTTSTPVTTPTTQTTATTKTTTTTKPTTSQFIPTISTALTEPSTKIATTKTSSPSKKPATITTTPTSGRTKKPPRPITTGPPKKNPTPNPAPTVEPGNPKYRPSAQNGSGGGMDGGSTAAVVVVILLLTIVAVVIGVLFYKRRLQLPHSIIQRFRRSSDDEETDDFSKNDEVSISYSKMDSSEA